MPTSLCADASLYAPSPYTVSSTSTTTWIVWNSGYVTTVEDLIWGNWQNNTHTGDPYNGQLVVPAMSAELNRREAEARAKRQAQEAEREAAWQVSLKRARELFDAMLTPEQHAQVDLYRYFEVIGSQTRRRYRVWVNKGRHGNIEVVDDHGPVEKLCVAPQGTIPEHDAFLGQKLFIEHDEPEFLQRANVQWRRAA